ncbi:hypothetical protein [Streptomyces vilmorinianum]|uniref:hypothetical protein n=1 Tax=Streptomyces vilmorinianum TaxID=3051092 RepID=UPI0010FB2427|nr:hypothetical protein [Streptomyces vilmorinianum]
MTGVAPPTPAELARAVALEEAYEAAKPRTPDQVEEVTARIWGDWEAAYPDEQTRPPLLSFIREVAATRPVTIEGRGDVRAFWSFRSQPEGATQEVGHRFVAQACGESRQYQVLEDTEAGRQLDSYHLWQPEVQKALARDLGVDIAEMKEFAPEVWKTASLHYAKEATGPVVAFAADIGQGSVLGATEMPELLKHKNVGKEGVRFALPFPRHEHLPAEVDGLMSDEAVRCQMRMEDYDPKKSSPKEFAEKLAAIDVPERQKAALEAVVARLSTAKSYEELTAPSAETEQPELKEPALTQPELKQPELMEPTLTEPEAKVPAPAQTVPKQPEVKQPEVKQPTPANAFMPGVTMPRAITVPARRTASASTHGVINPTIEAAPKSTDIER